MVGHMMSMVMWWTFVIKHGLVQMRAENEDELKESSFLFD